MNRQEVGTEVACNPQRDGDILRPANVPADRHRSSSHRKFAVIMCPRFTYTALRVSLHSTEALTRGSRPASALKHRSRVSWASLETTDNFWLFPWTPVARNPYQEDIKVDVLRGCFVARTRSPQRETRKYSGHACLPRIDKTLMTSQIKQRETACAEQGQECISWVRKR